MIIKADYCTAAWLSKIQVEMIWKFMPRNEMPLILLFYFVDKNFESEEERP